MKAGRFVTLALLLALSACGGLTMPTPPAITQVGGTWTGTYSSAQLGFGTAILTLAQSGTTITGTWSTRPSAGGGSDIGAGTASGIISSTGDSGTFVLALTPSDPRTCPFSATLTVFVAQRQLGGQFVTINCTVTASGTIILSKV